MPLWLVDDPNSPALRRVTHPRTSDFASSSGSGVATPATVPTPLVLIETPADSTPRRVALVVGTVSLGFFLTLAPFAAMPLGAADWFIPLNQSMLIVNDLVTATLLFSHLRLHRSPALLALGAAYVFAALMASVHMLSFPGV